MKYVKYDLSVVFNGPTFIYPTFLSPLSHRILYWISVFFNFFVNIRFEDGYLFEDLSREISLFFFELFMFQIFKQIFRWKSAIKIDSILGAYGRSFTWSLKLREIFMWKICQSFFVLEHIDGSIIYSIRTVSEL